MISGDSPSCSAPNSVTSLRLYLDFGSPFMHGWPLRYAPRGTWTSLLDDGCGRLRFFNPRVEKTLGEFIQELEVEAMSVPSTSWWRQGTTELHWYHLTGNKFFSDFGDKTDIPDIILRSAGANSDSIGARLSVILDRYGNEYRSFSWSFGVGGGVPWEYWEGYAARSGEKLPGTVPTEPELRDIVEGISFSVAVQMGASLGVDLGPNGHLLLYGTNPSIGAGISFGNTRFRGKSDKSWHWIDEIQGYNPSIRDAVY